MSSSLFTSFSKVFEQKHSLFQRFNRKIETNRWIFSHFSYKTYVFTTFLSVLQMKSKILMHTKVITMMKLTRKMNHLSHSHSLWNPLITAWSLLKSSMKISANQFQLLPENLLMKRGKKNHLTGKSKIYFKRTHQVVTDSVAGNSSCKIIQSWHFNRVYTWHSQETTVTSKL